MRAVWVVERKRSTRASWQPACCLGWGSKTDAEFFRGREERDCPESSFRVVKYVPAEKRATRAGSTR